MKMNMRIRTVFILCCVCVLLLILYERKISLPTQHDKQTSVKHQSRLSSKYSLKKSDPADDANTDDTIETRGTYSISRNTEPQYDQPLRLHSIYDTHYKRLVPNSHATYKSRVSTSSRDANKSRDFIKSRDEVRAFVYGLDQNYTVYKSNGSSLNKPVYKTRAEALAITEEHSNRIDNFHHMCMEEKVDNSKEEVKSNLTYFFYSREYRFAYCKVPKSGSTFWMKLFMILAKGDAYSQVINGWTRTRVHTKSKTLRARPEMIMHHNIKTVLVSRNPYSRLFSAFIDKLYVPIFWENFENIEGAKILKPFYFNSTKEVFKLSKRPIGEKMQKYRGNLRKRGLLTMVNISTKVTPICANNASFEQFLRYIISEVKAKRMLEPHWAPISDLCRPCLFNTYKIVKQESFSDDVIHVLDSFGVNVNDYNSVTTSLQENRAKSTIPSVVGVVAIKTKMKSVAMCISQYETVRRMWKSFQIQGFISDEIPCPDNLLTSTGSINEPEVTKAALEAMEIMPMTSEQMKKQRHAHLVEAYSEISEQTIREIQVVYKNDFELFNYSIKPPANH